MPLPVGPIPPPSTTTWLPVLVAALLAAGLTRLFGLRRPESPRLRRLGQGAGFAPFAGRPGTGDGHSVWIGGGAFAADLAARLAARGPVLLVGSSVDLSASTLPIWAPERERPTPREVLEAAAELAKGGIGPAIIIVHASALERPADGRPTATLEELLRSSSYPVFVVLEAGAARPDGPWRVVEAP